MKVTAPVGIYVLEGGGGEGAPEQVVTHVSVSVTTTAKPSGNIIFDSTLALVSQAERKKQGKWRETNLCFN